MPSLSTRKTAETTTMENVMIPATAAAVTGHGNATGATPRDFFDPRHPACINYGTVLPHWQQKAKIIFMTMRLADSLPQSLLNQYKEDLARDADSQTFIDKKK